MRACRGMVVSARRAEQEEVMVAPLGVPAVMGLEVSSLLTTGASLRRKWLVHPESMMARSCFLIVGLRYRLLIIGEDVVILVLQL